MDPGPVLMDESAWPVNYEGDYGVIRTIHHATLLYSPQSQLLSNIDPLLCASMNRGGGAVVASQLLLLVVVVMVMVVCLCVCFV